MKVSLAQKLGSGHVLMQDIKPKMAKVSDLTEVQKKELAGLRVADADEAWRVLIGEAVEKTRLKAGLSQKEFAAAIRRDQSQLGRWERGEEHAQFAAIFAVPEFRALAVLSLAEIAKENVEVIYEVRIRA